MDIKKLTEDDKLALQKLKELEGQSIPEPELEKTLKDIISGFSNKDAQEFFWSDEDYEDQELLLSADDIECEEPYTDTDGRQLYIDCQPL